MKHNFYLFIYYAIARWLPASYRPGGRFGKALRVWCCRHIFAHCGSDVNIERGAFFGNGRMVRLGSRSGIGEYAHLKNNTIIGDDVMMGPNFIIQESRHAFDRTDIPMGQQPGLPPQQVIIGNDIWIGADVMIVGNRKVNDGTILAARTVLVKEFPTFSIVGGNPSRLIRLRKQAEG